MGALESSGVPKLPVAFLGLAEHFEMGPGVLPVAPSTIFRLSIAKKQYFYPAPISTMFWMFLIDTESVKLLGGTVVFRITRKGGGDELGRFRIELSTVPAQPEPPGPTNPTPTGDAEQGTFFAGVLEIGRWLLWPGKFVDATVPEPGTYAVYAAVGHSEFEVGEVHFLYQPRAPFTLDEQRAIQSDPYGSKFIRFTLVCKLCGDKVKVYTALNRDDTSENEGFTWQHDVQESYACSCGGMRGSMHYIRESLHAMLGRDVRMDAPNISHGRRYGHEEIMLLLDQFNRLLHEEDGEAPFQKFIEEHPVMLARFNALELRVKPSILGKHQPDFVVLDARHILWLIELERPSLQLFKKSEHAMGHATAELNHAYEQVHDWLHACELHRFAVLDVLGIKHEEVLDIRGMVIGGRSKHDERDELRRHLSTLKRQVDFMTLDDLAESLFRASRDLA